LARKNKDEKKLEKVIKVDNKIKQIYSSKGNMKKRIKNSKSFTKVK
jgi:hypothetical protein